MKPGALFDRRKFNMEKGQIGFIDFIILPLWINWTTFIGAEEEWIKQINLNKKEWQRRAAVEMTESESPSASLSSLKIETNKMPERLCKERRSIRDNPQKKKDCELRERNSRLRQTLRRSKHQDEIYTKQFENEEIQLLSLDDAVLPSKERKPSFSSSCSLHKVKAIKSCSSQLCSRGQSVDDDGIFVMPNIETRRSSKLIRPSNSSSFGKKGDNYTKE